jgi:cytochrome c-type biogenesis protein CcmH
MRQKHRFALAALVLGLCSPITAAFAGENTPNVDVGEKVPGAERLEGRLLAPCCWAQTLDIHGSEIANSLRKEIRARLKAGETADAIEASLIARYGEKIRAVPDKVPLDEMGGLGWLGVASAAGLIGMVLWRWRQRGQLSETDAFKGSNRASAKEAVASDERLDSELKRLDDN